MSTLAMAATPLPAEVVVPAVDGAAPWSGDAPVLVVGRAGIGFAGEPPLVPFVAGPDGALAPPAAAVDKRRLPALSKALSDRGLAGAERIAIAVDPTLTYAQLAPVLATAGWNGTGRYDLVVRSGEQHGAVGVALPARGGPGGGEPPAPPLNARVHDHGFKAGATALPCAGGGRCASSDAYDHAGFTAAIQAWGGGGNVVLMLSPGASLGAVARAAQASRSGGATGVLLVSGPDDPQPAGPPTE